MVTRPKRTILLLITVALSVALVVSVACAIASAHAAVKWTADLTIGRSDVRITHAFRGHIPPDIYDLARSWPSVAAAVTHEEVPVSLLNTRTRLQATARGVGVVLDAEYDVRPVKMLQGRLPAADFETILDPMVAEKLDARVGDSLLIERIGEPILLQVVGISDRPQLPILQRREIHISDGTLRALRGRKPRYASIDIVLEPNIDPAAFVEQHRAELPERLLIQTTERVTSRLHSNLASSQISFLLAGVLTFMAASFIILTGMTVAVAERTRELAMLRCIGAARAQLAVSQLWIGLFLGTAGSILGVPLGIGLAYTLYLFFSEHLIAGFHIHPLGIILGTAGSLLAGLGGAVHPAWQAATTSPLTALTVRAHHPRLRGIIICAILGLALIALQLILLRAPHNLQTSFWTYIIVGLPAMYLGYFLVCVPIAWLIAAAFGPVVSRILRLPAGMLVQSVHASPYRFAFTAGAQMVGLSIMITIWSSGTSLFRDWIDQIRFPDAFVHAWFGLEPEHYELIKSLDFVENTCATTLFAMDVRNREVFGVSGLQQFKTHFVSFEPDEFFEMTGIDWVQGDPETAKRRLNEGGAIIVAREFLIAKGIGVGDTLELGFRGHWATFEIVGVVASPGLNIATRIFGIGEAYLEQAISCVFGSREDATTIFGNDDINLIQIELARDVDHDEALAEIVKTLNVPGLTAGSGRQIRDLIDSAGVGMMTVGSFIAFAGLLVACLGVGNIIMANLHARRFEYGVLLAIGADRALLARAILAEAALIAAVACIMGTLVGLQAADAGNVLYAMYGLSLHLRAPAGPIALGCAILCALTFAFALPAVWSLMKTQPRDLLASE
ncbi:MAG: ABC transporter permease [Phycisphaerales bacterium]|nr:ABC transporter permease [Phycisphaerales bacterium]